eukprot:38457-Chlamydomonas_euryale.AAC.1
MKSSPVLRMGKLTSFLPGQKNRKITGSGSTPDVPHRSGRSNQSKSAYPALENRRADHASPSPKPRSPFGTHIHLKLVSTQGPPAYTVLHY